MATTAADRFGMDETTSLLRKDAVQEQKPSAKKLQNFPYAVALAVVTGLIFFLVSNNMPKADIIENMESSASSGKSAERKVDTTNFDIDTVSMHLTLQINEETGLATLVDRAPVACRPSSSLSTWFKCGEGSTTVLATADYRVNHNGNGWNYLSIEATDMRELLIETTAGSSAASGAANNVHAKASAAPASHQKAGHTVHDGRDGDAAPKQVASMRFGDLIDKLRAAKADLSPVRQQYVRTMHAIGMLEGFLACKEIGEWYANFYDGLFEGGEVNRPTMEFLEQNHVWMNNQASMYWEVDEYWMVVRGIMAQLEGLLIGAQRGCPGTPLDNNFDDDAHSISDYKGIYMPSMEHGVAMQHLLLMNANGDMFQIMQKFPANVVNSTTTRTGRHGDGTIDTTPTIDDYVDDYTINLAHKDKNATTPTDDETYVYGDEELLGAEGPDASLSAADAYRAKHYPPQLRQSRAATPQQRSNPGLFYQPRKFLPSDIPVADANATPKPMSDKLTAQQVLDLPNIGADHCSAIIKLLPDKSDVVFGHDTWDSYQTAFPRVFKHIRYNRMKNSLPIAADMIDLYFSASPGLLASIDDFYIIHGEVANLAVIETSLDLYNQDLMQLIYPSTMLCWARAIAANRMATSGNTWVETFSRYHSGTYSNQWMVLDFNKFQPYQAPRAGFLTVLEELPGLTHHEDLTDTLVTKGYWASYNNPYFKEISVISGVYAKCQLDATYCHPSTPRAKIFREQQGALRTVGDVQALMLHNRYATDRASGLDSCKAIACRKDLEPAANRRAPFGAIDAKVSSVTLAKRLPITYPSSSGSGSGSGSGSNLRSSFPNDRYHLTGNLVTATTNQGTVVRQSAYYGVIKPVILTKLGPSTDRLPPFCWTAVGETTSDATVMFVNGMVLPDTVIEANITAPVGEDTSNTRRLRALQEATSATSDSSTTTSDSNSAVQPAADAVLAEHHEDPVSVAATPTMQPTFLEGPRKYVHWGHPRCFDFGWETMPPQDTRTKHSGK